MDTSATSPRPSRAPTIAFNLVTVAFAIAALFAAVFVVSVIVGVARGGESLLGGDKVYAPVELSTKSLGPLPMDISFPSWIPVKAGIEDPTTEQMLLSSALEAGPILIVLATLWLLWGLARSVTQREPFGRQNVARLRRLGYVFVLGVPIFELVATQIRKALWESLPPNSAVELGVAGMRLPATALLAGLGAFVLAEVFAHGVRLREDVEATI